MLGMRYKKRTSKIWISPEIIRTKDYRRTKFKTYSYSAWNVRVPSMNERLHDYYHTLINLLYTFIYLFIYKSLAINTINGKPVIIAFVLSNPGRLGHFPIILLVNAHWKTLSDSDYFFIFVPHCKFQEE